MSVSGIVDKIGNGSITAIGQNISTNIAGGPVILPFNGIINSSVHTHPVDFANGTTNTTVVPPIVPVVPPTTDPNGTATNGTGAGVVAPTKVGKSNLAAILIPSIIGGLLLLGLLAALLCYCCKCCCFKKGAGTGSAE